jgi:hypothetical protein
MGNLIDPTQYEREQQALVDQRQNDLEKELSEARSADDDKVPDKYRGKSLEEVIAMHEEAERKASRLGNEVGQLRSQVLQRRETREQPKKVEVNVDTLLENPQETIQSVARETVRELEETVDKIEQDRLRREFESRHKDYKQDLSNDSFYDWIKANPVRVSLAQSADTGDYQAANLLWDMWAEIKDVRQSKADAQKQTDAAARAKKLKDGTLESGTGSTTESKKVFRRSEIRDLKTRAKQGDRKAQAIVDDPSWQQEVLSAYEQKRVI